MKSLLLTLGHNSSAIFIEDGKKPIGYEEERFTGIKADSQFPKNAIAEIVSNVGIKNMKGCKVFISHWFDFNEESIPNKYIEQIDLDNLKEISQDITFVNPEFTHHDAHAWSAKAFFNYHINKQENYIQRAQLESNSNVHIIVADGFGNNGEVLSIYEINDYVKDNTPKLVHRVYGYENSIGLMYQYATSYVGMKENQDEYKFLGYEAHIDEYLDTPKIEFLETCINNLTGALYSDIMDCTDKNFNYKICSDIINFKKLDAVKRDWAKIFDEAYKKVWTKDDAAKYSLKENEFIQRTIVAYYLQQTVERLFNRIVKNFNMKNVIVCGGSFYNVKLNNSIFESIPGLFCAMPLAGDQGAAIGLYDYYTKEQFDFETLCIGKRNFYSAKKEFKNNFYKEATDDLAKEIARKIADGYIVDLVHGSMEFGPRALMHTSSLFLPSTKNTAQNNSNNLRNEVMPCAPVLTLKNACKLFGDEGIQRVVGSDEFMILTHTYKKDYSDFYGGVMHKIVLKDGHSGRPQIVRLGTFEEKILEYVEELTDAKCLVNTSFNKHGTPILFNMKQIKDDWNFQVEHSKANNFEKHPLIYVIKD